MARKVSTAGIQTTFRRRKKLEQDLDHITQEMYKRNRELAETNEMLSLLRTIDTLVLESQEPLQVVGAQIAKAVTDGTDYPFVALLARPSFDDSMLELYGYSVKNQVLPDGIFGSRGRQKVHVDELWLSADNQTALHSLANIDISAIRNLLGCSHAVAEKLLELLPLQTIYPVKLIVRGRLVGVLVAGFYTTPAGISHQNTQLFDRLAESVGIAVDNRLLFEENRRIVLQLQHNNTKLKALDETKDDFISMASHQLRTPLTSVKGYLSMVLDGDAGKLTALERRMLTQAFISSQRMVYLISDLLNVSRLKTGKFVMDLSEVNLADMISDEIAQLQETAKTRSLTLQYTKPKKFPSITLDEMKTRQVVMNFIDNAIYYTPSGGHIKIELNDKASSIELRVIDDGIGVPKSEQFHLFTKFYRAGNARQARPDGTGLGLFMAKKVVIGQGGSIIFDSRENQGSTFGFSFPKTAVQKSIDK